MTISEYQDRKRNANSERNGLKNTFDPPAYSILLY
jgi:hypothetical protein